MVMVFVIQHTQGREGRHSAKARRTSAARSHAKSELMMLEEAPESVLRDVETRATDLPKPKMVTRGRYPTGKPSARCAELRTARPRTAGSGGLLRAFGLSQGRRVRGSERTLKSRANRYSGYVTFARSPQRSGFATYPAVLRGRERPSNTDPSVINGDHSPSIAPGTNSTSLAVVLRLPPFDRLAHPSDTFVAVVRPLDPRGWTLVSAGRFRARSTFCGALFGVFENRLRLCHGVVAGLFLRGPAARRDDGRQPPGQAVPHQAPRTPDPPVPARHSSQVPPRRTFSPISRMRRSSMRTCSGFVTGAPVIAKAVLPMEILAEGGAAERAAAPVGSTLGRPLRAQHRR